MEKVRTSFRPSITRSDHVPKRHTPAPSPPRYRAFRASLAGRPQPGWEAVAEASDLRPGDVVAWEHKTETSAGHAVIIAKAPVAGPEGSWL